MMVLVLLFLRGTTMRLLGNNVLLCQHRPANHTALMALHRHNVLHNLFAVKHIWLPTMLLSRFLLMLPTLYCHKMH